MITMTTNYGDIILKLDFENTPKTTENFLKYVENNFYNDTIFHRVINGFMIQGGGFTSDMKEKTTDEPIINEADRGVSNTRGTIAMARTSDPHSATAQFFINVEDNLFLDHKNKTMDGWGYCVFGHVIDGMNVVDKIKVVETTSQLGHQDVPVEQVLIKEIKMTNSN